MKKIYKKFKYVCHLLTLLLCIYIHTLLPKQILEKLFYTLDWSFITKAWIILMSLILHIPNYEFAFFSLLFVQLLYFQIHDKKWKYKKSNICDWKNFYFSFPVIQGRYIRCLSIIFLKKKSIIYSGEQYVVHSLYCYAFIFKH